MDPKLHTLIPLMGSVALTFNTGCFGDKSSDEAVSSEEGWNSETGGNNAAASETFIDHCQAMADCDINGDFDYYFNSVEDCAGQMTSYLRGNGQDCLEAAEEFYGCAKDIAYCNEDGYLALSSESCEMLGYAMDAICYGEDDYEYEYPY